MIQKSEVFVCPNFCLCREVGTIYGIVSRKCVENLVIALIYACHPLSLSVK